MKLASPWNRADIFWIVITSVSSKLINIISAENYDYLSHLMWSHWRSINFHSVPKGSYKQCPNDNYRYASTWWLTFFLDRILYLMDEITIIGTVHSLKNTQCNYSLNISRIFCLEIDWLIIVQSVTTCLW